MTDSEVQPVKYILNSTDSAYICDQGDILNVFCNINV